jgi:hypothetical protein
LDAILNWGVLVVLWLQSLGDWLILPIKFFSFLGCEQFYLLLVPLINRCFNPGFGLRLGLGLMFSGCLNLSLKILLHGPRPYWIDARVLPWSSET